MLFFVNAVDVFFFKSPKRLVLRKQQPYIPQNIDSTLYDVPVVFRESTGVQSFNTRCRFRPMQCYSSRESKLFGMRLFYSVLCSIFSIHLSLVIYVTARLCIKIDYCKIQFQTKNITDGGGVLVKDKNDYG